MKMRQNGGDIQKNATRKRKCPCCATLDPISYKFSYCQTKKLGDLAKPDSLRLRA